MIGMKVCKLITNEFVIGRYADNGMLINILRISFDTNSVTGNNKMSLLPYMTPFDINLNHIISADKIIAYSDPTEHLIKQYVETIQQLIQIHTDTMQNKENKNIVSQDKLENDEQIIDGKEEHE